MECCIDMVKYATLKQVLNNSHIINETVDIGVLIINLILMEKHGKALHDIIGGKIHDNIS